MTDSQKEKKKKEKKLGLLYLLVLCCPCFNNKYNTKLLKSVKKKDKLDYWKKEKRVFPFCHTDTFQSSCRPF